MVPEFCAIRRSALELWLEWGAGQYPDLHPQILERSTEELHCPESVMLFMVRACFCKSWAGRKPQSTNPPACCSSLLVTGFDIRLMCLSDPCTLCVVLLPYNRCTVYPVNHSGPQVAISPGSSEACNSTKRTTLVESLPKDLSGFAQLEA